MTLAYSSSDTARSSDLATREDEEVPRGGSHKPRDVPCGGGVCEVETCHPRHAHPSSASPPPVPLPPGPLCYAAQLRAAGEHTGDLHAPTTHPLRAPRARAAPTPALCAPPPSSSVVGKLRVAGEHTDDLHAPTSLHSLKQLIKEMFCAERGCCNRMFQVFQVFQRYVASVLYLQK